MYNDNMCTQTMISRTIDFWQELAEVVNQKASANNGVVPHNDTDIFEKCMHSRSKEDWSNLVALANKLKHDNPEMLNKGHGEVLIELQTILLSTYPDLLDDQNPLDHYHRKRVPMHKGKKMSHWGFRGIVTMREIWNNCDKPIEKERLKLYVRQQQEATFRRMFEMKNTPKPLVPKFKISCKPE